jgi:HAD superfamily hydrolase (TIGR01509 family)
MPEDAIWKEVDSLPRPNEALYRFISENIKGKYTLGLLTNVPRSLIDRVAGDRLDLFDIVIVSSDVKLIKPDPAIFKLAMQRASCSASDMTFVDDGPKNIEIAKTLGIDGILYTDLPTFKQALQARQ